MFIYSLKELEVSQGCSSRSNPGLKLANAFGVYLDAKDLVAGCAGALHLELVKSRNDRVGVVQKVLPGRSESRILVEFASGNHVVDLLLEISDLRDGVAELALIERQRNAVELAQQTGAILCLGLLAGDGDDLHFTFELSDHGLHFAHCRSLCNRRGDEHGKSKRDSSERDFFHHGFHQFLI